MEFIHLFFFCCCCSTLNGQEYAKRNASTVGNASRKIRVTAPKVSMAYDVNSVSIYLNNLNRINL